MPNVVDGTNKILMWRRVLKNLERNKDRKYVPELIRNVERTIRRLEKEKESLI